jgi:hypothetical protein
VEQRPGRGEDARIGIRQKDSEKSTGRETEKGTRVRKGKADLNGTLDNWMPGECDRQDESSAEKADGHNDEHAFLRLLAFSPTPATFTVSTPPLPSARHPLVQCPALSPVSP